MKKSISFTQIAVAIAASAAVGAMVGMLFAPKKGRDLRNKIVEEKDNIVKSMQNKFDSLLVNTKNEIAQEKANLKAAIDGKI